MSREQPKPSTSAADFPAPTAWSTILLAGNRESPEWKHRLDGLVRTYWRPVYWYLFRRWNLTREDASDLTQEFFVKLVEEGFLNEASPERGRFRTFLQLKLRDLVVDELRRRSAIKRGGGARPVPLDAGLEKGMPEPKWRGLKPEEELDRLWVSHLLSLAMTELESRLKAEGKEAMFQSLLQCAVESPLKSYRECAESLGIKESDVRNYVFRARGHLMTILRRHVKDSVSSESEVEDELAYLMGLLERNA